MVWLARLISLAIAGALGDAAVASLGQPVLAVASASGGALLALVALVAAWRAPWIGATLAALAFETAFAVGTLGGSDAGPRFTQLAASDSAAVADVAALVLAAAIALACFRQPLVRIAVFVALGYGIVALAAAVGHGGLGTAFRTSPLAWTGGPYLAVEIILPIAALAALVLGLRFLATKRASAGVAVLAAAAALLAATQLGAYAVGGQGLPTITAFEGRTAGEAWSGSSGATWGARVDPAFGPFDAERGVAFVPSGSGALSPEITAAAKTIASDPASALSAVATLADDFYPGALGGAVGALRSGSANSIDKALLLHDVLRANAPAIQTVFAQCTLSDSDADAFLASARAATKAHPKIVLQASADAANTTSDAAIRASLMRWGATWKALVATTQSDGAKLGNALHSANIAMPPGLAAPERLRRFASDHFWLRANIDGTWTDLDPTIDRATPGKTRCAPSATESDLPEDRYDVLGVRVVEETIPAAASGSPAPGTPLQRTVLLDRTLRTVDLADRDLSLMFAETVGLDDALGPHDAAPDGASRFTPLLHVGTENVVGTALLLPTPTAGANLGSSIASVLSGAFATPSPASNATSAPAALPIVTGLWSELSVSAPGTVATTVRSRIFDHLGYAARVARAPIPTTLTARPNDDAYRAMQTVWNIVASAGSISSATGPADAPKGSDASTLSANLARLNGAYTGVRRALTDDARGASVATAGSPGISIVAMTNSGPAMDVASDATVPLTNDDARPLWAAASLIAEREVMDGNALIATGGTGAHLDALTLLEKAPPSAVVATKASADASAPNEGTPDESHARLAAHIGAGDTILSIAVPQSVSSGPSFAWIVDGTDGTLRDEDSSGRHSELPESTVETNEVAIKNISVWKKFTCTIMPVIRAATFALSVAHNGSPFSPAGAAGLAAGQRAATQAAVDAAQAGQDQAVACGGP
jgi:hypothetical protein